MQPSKLSRDKWDVWTTIFWFIAFLTIPVAIYLVAELGFVQVPRYSGSYSTRSEINPGILISAIAFVASAFFAAALFSLMNDIYKRTFKGDQDVNEPASKDAWQVQAAGVKVKSINDGSPLEDKVKVGWRLLEVNDEAIHRSSQVGGLLVAGDNHLKFISSDGKSKIVDIELFFPPKLGLVLS